MSENAGQALSYREPRRQVGCSAVMADDQFDEWTRLLESRIGLFIPPERRSFLVSGLRARMREIGCKDYGEYYRQMRSTCLQAKEWTLLVDRLTVHETCFFRHDSSMKLVEEVVLPDAIDRNRGRDLRAWSVGCATGEEAYSLAMLMDSCCSALDGGHVFDVTGTDISLPSLDHAREGVYLNRRLRDIRDDFQQKYCRPVSASRFEVKSALRETVCFRQLNLRDLESAPFGDFDLIYCQNLLIYYERESRMEIVDNLAGFLQPGGVLVLGPGELLEWQHPDMEKVRYQDTLAYRRAD